MGLFTLEITSISVFLVFFLWGRSATGEENPIIICRGAGCIQQDQKTGPRNPLRSVRLQPRTLRTPPLPGSSKFRAFTPPEDGLGVWPGRGWRRECAAQLRGEGGDQGASSSVDVPANLSSQPQLSVPVASMSGVSQVSCGQTGLLLSRNLLRRHFSLYLPLLISLLHLLSVL